MSQGWVAAWAEKKAKWKHLPLPEELLKEWGRKLSRSEAYCSDQTPQNLMMTVWMILGFMPKEGIEAMKEDKITHLIAPVKEALPRSVNGHPMLMSAISLTKPEYDAIRAWEKRFRDAEAAVGASLSPAANVVQPAGEEKNEGTEQGRDQGGEGGHGG